MKKLFLSIIASIILSCSVVAQNVARECVLFEVFTGVGCPYCPAAAIAIGQMLDEGKSVAPVAFHTSAFSSPDFFTSETNARASYYSVYSYPTAKVDGIYSPTVGGAASSEENIQYSYNQCVARYNQRMNVTSPFSIDLSFEYQSGTECKVVANVNKVGECNSADVRLFAVVTESNIAYSWQGMSELNFVVRDMLPNQYGTQITSDNQLVELVVDMAGYPKENCEIVAWVQSYSGTKEVYQAVKLPLSSFVYEQDLAINNIEEVVVGSCSGKMAPRVSFKNNGSESLSSALFNVKDAAGSVLTSFQWEGALAVGELADFVFPEFNLNGASDVTVEAVNINGNADGYPVDNFYNIQVAEPASITDGYMKLQLRTGDDPENLSIEIKNMDDDEVIHLFEYDEPKEIYVEEISLPKVGCYRITFRNTAGNGFGGGFWNIKDSDNGTVMMGNNNENTFRYELTFELSCDGVGLEEMNHSEVFVFPNPASSVINISADNMTKVSVYNSIGQLVYTQDVDNDSVELSTSSWSNGLYYVNIETKDGYMTSQKVIVNK